MSAALLPEPIGAAKDSSRWPMAARLLLDEITDLKIELQAKLLRTIEDKKLQRIGAQQRERNTAGCSPDRVFE